MDARITKLVAQCKKSIESCDANLNEWKDKLDENPIYAMEWGEVAVHTAARRFVHQFIVNAAPEDVEVKVEDLIEHLDATAMRAMVRGLKASSTSTMSNLVERNVGEAWAAIWVDGPRTLRGILENE